MIPITTQCFMDPDSKLRLYALESLYNYSKLARGKILKYLDDVFDYMCKLVNDSDLSVKNGVEFLDNLIKEIISEGNSFNQANFFSMFSKHIRFQTSQCRKFLLSWLIFIDKIPNLSIVEYIPKIIDGIFKMLYDPSEEMRSTVVTVLFQLLNQIEKNSHQADYENIIPLIIPYCLSSDQFNFIISLTALSWIEKIIIFAQDSILGQISLLLSAILPCISHSSKAIEDCSSKSNSNLQELIQGTEKDLNYSSILDIVKTQLTAQRVPSRLCALEWILVLQKKSKKTGINNKMFIDVFNNLIMMLTDPAEEVVKYNMIVLSTIALDDYFFEQLIVSLIEMFKKNLKLLENRGYFIIRQLSLYIPPEKIYLRISKLLEQEKNYKFTSKLIQILNLILLTSTEFHSLRELLKSGINNCYDLFVSLHSAWCHNPPSLLSLCLLTQVYRYSSKLVIKLFVFKKN